MLKDLILKNLTDLFNTSFNLYNSTLNSQENDLPKLLGSVVFYF